MITKHTPGEWSFSPAKAVDGSMKDQMYSQIDIYAGNGTHICQKTILTKYLEEHLSNAKLIAAAPELLKVCQMLLEDSNNLRDLYDKAEQAIKKATE